MSNRWSSAKGISTAADLIAALNDFLPRAANYPFGGVTPGVSFTHPQQFTGLSLQDGTFYFHIGPDSAESDPAPNYQVVYVRDSKHPGADTPDEAVAAMADDFRRVHAEVVAVGDVTRNDANHRWEIQVVTRATPAPAAQVHELTLPVSSWKIWGPVDTGGLPAECFCCGKLASELVMLVIDCGTGHPFRTTHHFQVDIRHYAKRVGVTVDDARAERDAAVRAVRRRVSEGVTVRREPLRRRGWALYKPGGAPVIDVLFPSEQDAEHAKDALAQLAQHGPLHEEHVREIMSTFHGHPFDGIVHVEPTAKMTPPAGGEDSSTSVNLYETTVDGRESLIIQWWEDAWMLGPITPDETGEFVNDARAWCEDGAWPGQVSGAQGIAGRVEVGEDIIARLTPVARYHRGAVEVLVPPGELGLAAVYLNITTAADSGPGPEGDLS